MDALRSPIALLTAEGAVSARTSYDAFGEVRAQLGTTGTLVTPDREAANAELLNTDGQAIGFTGYLKDTESGLYYAKARYYDPATARFTTADPEAGKDLEPPSLHRYLYAYANPTYYMDPDGRQTLPMMAAETEKHRQEVSEKLAAANGGPIFFKDRGVNVVVMPLPTPAVVQRGALGRFSSAALAEDTLESTEVEININLYEWAGTWRAQGEVVSNAKVIGGRPSPDGFYVSWTKDRPEGVVWMKDTVQRLTGEKDPPAKLDPSHAWEFGKGNPPHNSDVAFGGAIPVIMEGMKYGVGNTYSADAPPGLPATGDPGAENRKYLTQRNSKAFAAQEHQRIGKTVMGINSDSNLMYVPGRQNSCRPDKLSP